MNEQEQNANLMNICKEFDKTSSLSNNTTFHSFNVSIQFYWNIYNFIPEVLTQIGTYLELLF
jgi:hypothetical protein